MRKRGHLTLILRFRSSKFRESKETCIALQMILLRIDRSKGYLPCSKRKNYEHVQTSTLVTLESLVRLGKDANSSETEVRAFPPEEQSAHVCERARTREKERRRLSFRMQRPTKPKPEVESGAPRFPQRSCTCGNVRRWPGMRAHPARVASKIRPAATCRFSPWTIIVVTRLLLFRARVIFTSLSFPLSPNTRAHRHSGDSVVER